MGWISGAISKGLSLFKLNQATATESQVLDGYTFYSKSKNIRKGNLRNNGAWNATSSGDSVGIPAGYHNGNGRVSIDGGNHGAWSSSVGVGGAVPVPRGWHNGSGYVTGSLPNSIRVRTSQMTYDYSGGTYTYRLPGRTIIGISELGNHREFSASATNMLDYISISGDTLTVCNKSGGVVDRAVTILYY